VQCAIRRRWDLKRARRQIAQIISKVEDESTGGHYYYNARTGETYVRRRSARAVSFGGRLPSANTASPSGQPV